MAFITYVEEGYLTLLAYIFTMFLEYLIFVGTFKHEETPEGETVRLRFWEGGPHAEVKRVVINLAIFLLLIPFTIYPLKNIMKHFLESTGAFIIPFTLFAGVLGYLTATKEHIDHHWRKKDTVLISIGFVLFLVSFMLIARLGL